MRDWRPDICIYHGNCEDGFGAAWAIWRRWPDCTFVPGFYGKGLPKVDGERVLFVDFSAPIDWIWEHSFKSRGMVIIDHHKSAQAALERLPMFDGTPTSLRAAFQTCWSQNSPEVAAWFDMNQSGAVMAWRFAHGREPVPGLLEIVQDRDLWRFAHGERTRRVSAALRTYPHDFLTWQDHSIELERLDHEGRIILRAHRANLQKIVAESYFCLVGDVSVPVVNAPYHYASDAADLLLTEFPNAPFAGSWFRRADGLTQWSLRSQDHRADVSEVAKQFGGGGHRNAAGFQVFA